MADGGWRSREYLNDESGRKAHENSDETFPENRVADTQETVLHSNMVRVPAEAYDQRKGRRAHDAGLHKGRRQMQAPPHQHQANDGRGDAHAVRVAGAVAGAVAGLLFFPAVGVPPVTMRSRCCVF